MAVIGHYIGGKTVSTAGRSSPVFDPSTGAQSGVVLLASTATVGETVAAAAAAQPQPQALFFFLMIRRGVRSRRSISSGGSDVFM